MLDTRTSVAKFKSFTGVLLIAGLLYAVSSPMLSHGWLDGQLFWLGTQIMKNPAPVDELVVVELPADVMIKPEQIDSLSSLVRKLSYARAAGTALLIEPLPRLDFQKDKSGKWSLGEGEQIQLAQALERYKVIAGITSSSGQSGFYSSGNTLKDNPDNVGKLNWLPDFMLPQPNRLNALAGDPYNYARYPISRVAAAKAVNSLVWFDNQSDKLIPDLATVLYAQFLNSHKIIWHEGKAIELGKQFINTDYSGEVRNYFSEFTGNQPQVKHYSLAKALKASSRSFKNKLVVAGVEGDPYLQELTNRVASLMTERTYHAPAWSFWMEKLLLLFVLVYLVFLLSRVQKFSGLLLSLLLFFGGVVYQYGLLLTQEVWIPMATVYLYLLFGHIVVQIHRSIESKLASLRLQAHEALLHLGNYQFDQGDFEKALPNLLRCKPTMDVLDRLYDIGLGFERRRQYEKAFNLFSEINARKPDFKDVKNRLVSLTNISGVQTEVITPGQMQKTLIMPDLGLQLPVLGRYEIERELGRGAMGIVYLGKDPKINRQVAIKTLDYSQFSESEVKTIKARFFREAEAAGRLNHPNIVTVYDVGEEDGLSFIAMDYVQGVSLGQHTKPEVLLPVKKVYEIIAEVAETLDYAHRQKIVHRDIKPGNIMYNPQDGLVKITDFGIARITDSVRTTTGSFMGSPSYMAPEQMTGTNVDGHADIYALGVSFYQLLCGELPFQADSLGNLAYKITREKHKPIREVRSDLPSSATRIINKALQKKPENRFASGKEMAEAVRRGMP
ncbi:MAG: serine/threonine protein kinase [Gammaproteobacteria bacterium]|nr:serine/threonine protein kinase [Gammaproteobacteria bacterium]